MPPLSVSASVITTDRSQKVDGSASIHQGSYKHEGDLKSFYLLVLALSWNGRTVKITSWNDDPSENLSDKCVKSAWAEMTRGMAYQSGAGITRYLKEETKRKEGLDLQVPSVVEALFGRVLEKLKTEMVTFSPPAPPQEAVDPVEAEFKANELRAES